MPRMRTTRECIRLLLEADPDTNFTHNALYTKVRRGEIPCVRVGNKRLINYDQLLEILQNPPASRQEQATYGEIRRVVG